ncbi:RUS1 family protein-like protein [Golovinomyces cichoracearum]|uniref:RUS1 family protein-like protein n=1 Tax=Golovinomyces cichoracearum TaxID=62708 RepID=A0A420IT51_9PEZI|nr:RUS1 family protein-like protein [Golovinomyces cichoracearum]
MAQERLLNKNFIISEVDLAGNHVVDYITTNHSGKSHRIDLVVSKEKKIYNYLKNVIEIFLPVGYPNSVTADYLPYQIFDSLQAFSSSIAGMITSRALLEGIGVGDSTASPTSALLLSAMQESVGRLGTIVFADRLGTSLEPECKMYRFAADIFNDIAMIIDCLSSTFPRAWRLPLWCMSSVLRSMCGVAAGSSKASLSAHFAIQNNLGELNAKDSSQETVISLLGMLAGSVIVPCISSKWATWTTLILLLAIHLGTNYLAVRSVCMRSFNRQRANIFFSKVIHDLHVAKIVPIETKEADLKKFISSLELPSPKDISRREKIFERDGILRWVDGTALGRCKLGVSIKCILDCFGSSHSRTGSFSDLPSHLLQQLLLIYQDSNYILYYDEIRKIHLVAIKCFVGNETEVQLKAWIQALYLAKYRKISDDEPLLMALMRSREFAECLVNAVFSCSNIKEVGWDLEVSAMKTHPSTKFVIKSCD